MYCDDGHLSVCVSVCLCICSSPHFTLLHGPECNLGNGTVEEGGSSMCRKTLLRKLNEYHGENVLILSSPGFANIMGFRSALPQSLQLVCLNKLNLA